MTAFTDSLLPWALAAVLLFWFVGAYNRLVRLRAAALQSYAVLDAALLHQVAFVEADLAAKTHLAASHASHQFAAMQLQTLLAATRSRPLAVGALAGLNIAARAFLTTWHRRLKAETEIAEAGDLASLPWPENAGVAARARDDFNGAIANYNAAVSQFPAVVIAWLFSFHRATPFL